mgnify:CR=1 FL=1
MSAYAVGRRCAASANKMQCEVAVMANVLLGLQRVVLKRVPMSLAFLDDSDKGTAVDTIGDQLSLERGGM